MAGEDEVPGIEYQSAQEVQQAEALDSVEPVQYQRRKQGRLEKAEEAVASTIGSAANKASEYLKRRQEQRRMEQQMKAEQEIANPHTQQRPQVQQNPISQVLGSQPPQQNFSPRPRYGAPQAPPSPPASPIGLVFGSPSQQGREMPSLFGGQSGSFGQNPFGNIFAPPQAPPQRRIPGRRSIRAPYRQPQQTPRFGEVGLSLFGRPPTQGLRNTRQVMGKKERRLARQFARKRKR